jgi:hypothetical protein
MLASRHGEWLRSPIWKLSVLWNFTCLSLTEIVVFLDGLTTLLQTSTLFTSCTMASSKGQRALLCLFVILSFLQTIYALDADTSAWTNRRLTTRQTTLEPGRCTKDTPCKGGECCNGNSGYVSYGLYLLESRLTYDSVDFVQSIVMHLPVSQIVKQNQNVVFGQILSNVPWMSVALTMACVERLKWGDSRINTLPRAECVRRNFARNRVQHHAKVTVISHLQEDTGMLQTRTQFVEVLIVLQPRRCQRSGDWASNPRERFSLCGPKLISNWQILWVLDSGWKRV